MALFFGEEYKIKSLKKRWYETIRSAKVHKKPKNIKNFEGSLPLCQRCIKQRSCYSSSIGVLPRHSPFTAFHRCCFEHVLILICIYTLAALCRNLTPIEIDGAKCRVVVDLDANNIRLLFMSRGIKHTLLGLWKIGNCIILKIHHTTTLFRSTMRFLLKIFWAGGK